MDKIKIELNGKPIIPRELTVREVEFVMESLMDTAMHPLEAMCPDEPIPAVAVALSIGQPLDSQTNSSTEITERLDSLKDILPSQVPELFKQVREKNSFLAGAVENLAAAARQMQSHQQDQDPDSTTSDDQSVG